MSGVLRLVPRATTDAAATAVDDARLVEGLKARAPWAGALLVGRYGDHVRRVLARVLGATDQEHADLVQEVMSRAWEGVGRLSDAAALKGWITNVAVFTAREALRRRRRRRWLSFLAEPPEREAPWADPDLREAAQCVYQILDRMPVDERIPFALRALEGMELVELAAACDMSVATVRRRLASAEARFFKLARNCEALAPWMQGR